MDERTDVLRRFGSRLRTLRKARGLSQEKLGFACDLSQTYISEVEQGKRNVSLLNLHALAGALGLTISQLTNEVD